MKTLSGGCRLCGSEAHAIFDLDVLGSYQVGYYRCDTCGSLQTEAPYWLDEAYASRTEQGEAGVSNLNSLDTGAARRNLDGLGVAMTVANLFGCTNAIDIGGGDGLLCRLMRDHGINAFVRDNYAKPTYAQGFTSPNFDQPDLLTAFEVFEHFSNPRQELDALALLRPRIMLIMTTPYTGQGKAWPYLIPATGQHIFFYSEKALQWIAHRYGYDLFRAGDYSVFCAKGNLTSARRALLRFRMRGKILWLYRMILSGRAAQGYIKDAQLAAVQPR